MSIIQSLEYLIDLSTGERINVYELDPERVNCLTDKETMLVSESVINMCSRMPRSAIESAKIGNSKHFEELMRTPAVGNLLKMEKHSCSEINICAIAKSGCTTKNVFRTGNPGRFPICWEFDIGTEVIDRAYNLSKILVGCVVHAWREGKLVVIVD